MTSIEPFPERREASDSRTLLDRQAARDRKAGMVLIAAALIAMLLANSRFAAAYDHLLHLDSGIVLPRVGPMTLHIFVVDGLMAIFFLLVGLEVKREWFEGRLASPQARRLPVLAAIAGMIVPAIFYVAIVGIDSDALRGWAIPTATDIAFAVAMLAILGKHAPPSLKVMLVSIAVIDDVGAVLIIAIVYTASLDSTALSWAVVVTLALTACNRLGVRHMAVYMAGFVLLWLFVLKSGVHPTIAGVLAALTVPRGPGKSHSTLEHMEHRLHPWVMFVIVPAFGFVSAGVTISGLDMVVQPLPLAILAGLFIGKQLGVFTAIRLGSKAGMCCLPEGVSWLQIYGASILCGIGFTMSLFIGAIAFPRDPAMVDAAKIGTFVGSMLSALLGWSILRVAAATQGDGTMVASAERLFAGRHRDPPRRSIASRAFPSGAADRRHLFDRDDD